MSITTNPIAQEPTTSVHDAGPLAALHLEDEVAWLDITARMIREGDIAGLDLENLAEFLTDMSNSQRREVKSRLVVLLVHLLKWDHQPEERTPSWLSTSLAEQRELVDLAGRGVLRAHAEAVLDQAYAAARKEAAVETSLLRATFPERCPYSFDQLLSMELPEGDLSE